MPTTHCSGVLLSSGPASDVELLVDDCVPRGDFTSAYRGRFGEDSPLESLQCWGWSEGEGDGLSRDRLLPRSWTFFGGDDNPSSG